MRTEATPIEVEAETQAIAIRDEMPVEKSVANGAPTTPAQAKVDAIASLTMAAYQKAATLNLTPEESAALQADFPDDAFQPGAAGKEHLLYIEHAHLRDRFTKVFGMGQWAIIPRNRWAEPFRTQKGDEGSRVYVEAMLVVRGCFVGEAIGAMEYYPKNAAQNYGDAVEGAKTAAFRRCAKEFGVGLQAWKKDWCESWWQRHWAAKRKPTAAQAPQGKPSATPPEQVKQAENLPTHSSPVSGAATGNVKASLCATPEQHAKLVQALAPQRELAERYFRAINWLLPTETIESLMLGYVPATKKQFELLVAQLDAVARGEEPIQPYAPNEEPLAPPRKKEEKAPKPIEVPRDANIDPNSPDAPWRVFPVPFGKHAGVTLGELDKAVLFGFWANFEVETEYNGKPKRADTIERDEKFREMLDEAGNHYQFKKPEDKQ